ncbi:H-2 class I histocompatibility antigen, Q9 alpha chain-like [Clarias gariepinus]
MEEHSAVIKVLLFITFSVHLSSGVTHTLEYSYTMVTPGSHFTSVGLLDGEEFMYYNNNTAKMTPKTEWMKNEIDSSYWERETHDVAVKQDWLMSRLQHLTSSSQEVNTLQRVYGCEIDDKNIIRGYDKSIYNGRDFISLNLNTGTWTALDPRAQSFTEGWNPERKPADDWKDLLEGTCIEHLQRYMPYSTKKEDPGAAEERSDVGPEGGPEGGSYRGYKTAVTSMVVLVLVLAAAAVGFAIYNKKLCAHLRSEYVGARQNPEQ